ncbi:IS3 family transposase [Bacillus cereus]|nr:MULTISPECIES: IS3 family transposase [Bacillus cereus group]
MKRHKTPSKKQSENIKIKKKIVECHKNLREIYGYRRIKMWPKAIFNLRLNHKRIERLMSELCIKSIIMKKRRLCAFREPSQ